MLRFLVCWGGWHESAVEMLLSRRNRSTLDSIAQVFRPYQKVHLPQSLASGCGSYHLVFLLDLELKKKYNWDRRWIGVTRWRCTWWWSLWRSCGTSFFHCRRGRWWSSTGSGNWDSTKNAWRMGSPGLGWIRGYSITPYFQVMKFGHLEVFFEQPDPRNDHHGLGKPRIQVRPGMIHPPSGLPKTGNFFSGTTSFSESHAI